MKLKNREKDNWFDYKTFVMRGEIEMTKDEWVEASEFLLNEYNKAVKNCDTRIRDGLGSGFIPKELIKNLINVGITATRLLVDKYDLRNYKDVNYLIRIKK